MSIYFARNFTQLHIRSFHTSRRVLEEWTKASLRRMKKPDLVQLAKDNKLNITGTKNEIIIRLLSHQTAKIVGNSTPSLHSIKKALEKEEEPEISAEEVDEQWANAFAMKVAQRRSHRNPFQQESSSSSSSSSSKPHPMNDNLKSKVIPLIQEEEEEKPDSRTEEQTDTATEEKKEDDDDEMNKEWVKAFDLKVGSRASKRPYIDTLSPSAPTISESLDKITLDDLKTIDHKFTEPVSQHSKNEDSPLKDQQSHKLITTVIGSSMLVWYFGGSEGFSTIWQFFSS